MGLIAQSYNQDYRSVKRTFRWLLKLTLGGSDDELYHIKEAKRVLKELEEEKNNQNGTTKEIPSTKEVESTKSYSSKDVKEDNAGNNTSC